MSDVKTQVRDFWNRSPCGTEVTTEEKYSLPYFEHIEDYRYSVEPLIFSFAQFTRFREKRVLEVGVGAGTDFLQWVRAGAQAYGIDLTPEGIEHVRQRLKLYGLQAEELRVADVEALPYPKGFFDLVYSWGVIHHSPNTIRALEEIIRVTRPGGLCKIMVYNRHSLGTFYLWVKHALLKGRPWKSFAWCLYHFQESLGTKGYTQKEVAHILRHYPVERVKIKSWKTYFDSMELSKKRLWRVLGGILSYLSGGHRFGWFLTVEFTVRK
jgi:ubiquinone/menaquinone biosynthesis C-methylase UbiE